MRIYTRTGDDGTTSLIGGKRILKDDLRVQAYGTCDEANSMIGFALSFLDEEDWEDKSSFIKEMYHIQTTMFHVGAELAIPENREVPWKLKNEHINQLEKTIDKWSLSLEPLTTFILPSGNSVSSSLHVSRTIIRRAERIVVQLGDQVNPLILVYLNRLSDFLFVAARYVNKHLGGEEIPLQIETKL